MRRRITIDTRFTTPVFNVAEAARLVGMSPSTLSTWAKGYERQYPDRPPVQMGPVITSVPGHDGNVLIPFIGFVEAAVVQAFRRTGLPLQRIRTALRVLAQQDELEHALASSNLLSDGANILYDYSRETQDPQLGLLTIVQSGQRVYHDVISEYLDRITFGDRWATEIVVPVTRHEILRVRPNVARTRPLFISSGAPLDAIRSRIEAGESVDSVARDFDTPPEDVREALDAVWPSTKAA